VLAQQLVTVEVEVADQRHIHTHLRESVTDWRNRRSGFARVDGEPHQFGSRASERLDLLCGAFDVRGIGVRHRLNDDGCVTAYADGCD
jgi:hypothetical protein